MFYLVDGRSNLNQDLLEMVGWRARVGASEAKRGRTKNKETKMHPKNLTRFKSLDKLAADPRVTEIWDEGEDGLWVSLADGFNWDGCSCVHEYSCKDLFAAFLHVAKGNPY